MKKNFIQSLVILLLLGIFYSATIFAQESIEAMETFEEETSVVEQVAIFDAPEPMSDLEILARKLVGSYMVQLFIDGGAISWPLLFLLIWGLAWSIWKIVSLSYGRINLNNFLGEIFPLVKAKKYSEALELAKNTRGPVASIVYAALLKSDKDIATIEKAIENSATIEMAFLDKGLVAIAMTINLAPMLGFFGTIFGMIEAFDAIARAGDVDPTIVAEGIKVALVTTLDGLAIAIPILFINTIIYQMIDGITLDMQRTSDRLLEVIVENK